MDQLEFPSFPERQETTVQPVLVTPPRQKAIIEIWERDDEPDFVVASVEIRDGSNNLIALTIGQARRDMEWSSALWWAREQLAPLWYESHAPF